MSQYDRTTRRPDPLAKSTPLSASSEADVTLLEEKAGKSQVEFVSSTPGHMSQEEDAESLEKDLDKDWESDPANPRNWSAGKKWTATAIGSLHAFAPILSSTMMAPALPAVAVQYQITDPTVVAMTLSIFLLSYGIVALIFGPLSEMYGRVWVLHIANLFTMAFGLGCAFSPNTGTLIAFRLLSGLSGSASIAIGGGLTADLFVEAERAAPTSLFVLGMLLGPIVGPVCGGFIVQQVGLKWLFVVIACLCGFSSLLGIPLLRETYAPVLRIRQATRTRDPETARKIQLALNHGKDSKLEYLWANLRRPVILLFRSLICFMLSLYMFFVFGIYYLMFTIFGEFFTKTYGFSLGIGGLTYLGLGVGFCFSTIFNAKFADKIYHHLARKNGGVGKPEMRIPALFIGSLFIPVGVFWFGWSAQAKLHWIMPIIGSGIFGFGMMAIIVPIQLYLTDTFTYAASATAASSLFRNLGGFAFPLFGVQMFDAMGYGGGNSMLAGLAIVLGIPFPVWMYYKGEQLRASNPLTAASVKPSLKYSS